MPEPSDNVILVKVISKDITSIFSSWDSIEEWVLTTPLFLTTTITALIAISIALYNSRQNKKQDRIKAAIEFEKNYQHGEKTLEWKSAAGKKIHELFYEEDHCIRCKKMKPETRDEMIEFQPVSMLMNEWERCANGILSDVYDENLLYGTYATTLIDLFDSNVYFLLYRQEKASPRAYIKVTKLALKWKKRRDCETGGDFDPKLEKARKLLKKHHLIIYSQSFRGKLERIIYYKILQKNNSDELLAQARKLLTDHYYLAEHKDKHKQGLCIQANKKHITGNYQLNQN
jgi:hypothetical protein